jgi:hypothetical protein
LWAQEQLPSAGDELSDDLAGRGRQMNPLVVSVYSFDEGIDYLWAEDGRFLAAVPEEVHAAPRISTNDLAHRRFTRSFELPSGERRIVTAVYPILDDENTFPVLRDTLLALLIAFAAGLIVAIAHVAASSRRRPAPADEERETPVEPEADAEIRTAPELDTDLGLVPQKILLRRLDQELERAGFHEQDLSAALFAFFPVLDQELAYKNAQAILAFFAFHDLCFDAGQQRTTQQIMVAFPNTTLSEALGQVERFQRSYWDERHRWDRGNIDFRCGLSARSGRLVEGRRLYVECEAALRRAADVPGRIMGFQPDPQRYREYVSSRPST